MGATLYGGFFRRDGYDVLSYDLGVFNGEGINTKDRNTSKDLSARLGVRPFPGLLLSASYYRGEYGVSYLRRVRYGAGACYDRGPVVLRGEWIGGETGLPAGDERPAGGLLESSGWYVPVSYTHLDKRGLVAVRLSNTAARSYDVLRDRLLSDPRILDVTGAEGRLVNVSRMGWSLSLIHI